MSPLDHAQIASHIAALDIGDAREVSAAYRKSLAARSAAADGNGYVNNGSLFSTLDGMPVQQQNDVLNWYLLGQLAANNRANRTEDPVRWYNELVGILNSIGMVIGQFSFSEVSRSELGFNVGETVQNIMRNALTQRELDFLKRTIDAVEKPNNDGARRIFNQASASRTNANFQAGVAKNDTSLNISATLGAFHFNTSSNITDVIGFQWGSAHVSFFQGDSEMILGKSIADSFRKAVEDRLGGTIEDNIKDLDI